MGALSDDQEEVLAPRIAWGGKEQSPVQGAVPNPRNTPLVVQEYARCRRTQTRR